MAIEHFVDKLGRNRIRGYKRPHKEARKIVPKRKYDIKTAKGLISKHAYDMDVTHKQLADALGCSKGFIDNMLSPKGLKPVKPWMVNQWASLLGFSESDQQKILSMLKS